jgi:hypothetical protein
MTRTWLILVSVFLISACSESNNNPGTGGNGGDGGSGGTAGGLTYPLLDCDPLVPDFCGFPFPSNVYTVEDADTATGRRVALSESTIVGNDPGPWNEADGFSAGALILAQLTGATGEEFGGPQNLDQSVSASSPSILLDVEMGEPVPHFAEVDVRSTTEEQRSVMIRPVVRLRDNARYIVGFRNLTDKDDATVEPSPAFAALRDGTSSEEASVEARRDLYEDIFEHLADAGWPREEVQLAWDFNTASHANNTDWLTHMRDEALALVEEEGIQYRLVEPEPIQDPDNIAFRVSGEFRVPLYMEHENSGSLLMFGDDGLPEVNSETPWAWIPFEVLIPHSAVDDPAPIVEYGHGLLGTRHQIHTGGGHFQTFMNEYNYVFCATDLQGMADEDEAIIGTIFLSGEIAQARRFFDRLHQGFLNYILLMRMMKTTFAADETYGQYINPDQSYYYGISQGGIMGSVFMAMSPDVERGALGVMGQPYSLLLFRSKDFTDFLNALKEPYKDFREHQHIVGMLQMLWDRVEPNGYTHLIGENKSVLMRSALGDHQVTTLGAHIMARTVGAKHLDSGQRDVWQLDKVSSTPVGQSFYTEYDFDLPIDPLCNVPPALCMDPHEWPRRRVAAREQLHEFLSAGTGTNHCGPGDTDPDQATAEGVCSYPTLSGCGPDDDDEASQALCGPQ